MNIREEELKVERSQRIIVAGSESGTKLIVLHGYGQLPRFFVRKFQPLELNYRLIIPEGLHRFYLEGFSGRVGASWMTKENRLVDIQEQKLYLDKVLEEYKINPEDSVLLAFSQGIATAARWLHSGEHNFKKVILWAGNFPPDMDLDEKIEYWSNMNLHYVFGSRDEFFSSERVNELYQNLEARGLKFKKHKGDFQHDIDPSLLASIL